MLIENFCKPGMHERAIKMLDKLVGKGILLNSATSTKVESSAYNPMIQYLCNNGGTKKAEVFFGQLMKKGVQDFVALNNLICGHCKEENPDSAIDLVKIMQRRVIVLSVKSYETLIESFLKKGEPADAKTILDGMMENELLSKPSLFRSLMEGLFDDGRVQTASRVMNSMLEKGVTTIMDLVSKILKALILRGHVEGALR